jgi:hypothetical protein
VTLRKVLWGLAGIAAAAGLLLYLWAQIAAARAAQAAAEAGRAQVEAQRDVLKTALLNKDEKLRSLEATIRKLKTSRFISETQLPDGTIHRSVSEFAESEESSTRIVDSVKTTPTVALPTLPPPPAAVRSDRDFPLGVFAFVDTSLGWAAGPSWELIEIRPPLLPAARVSVGVGAGQRSGSLQGVAFVGLRFGPRK